jgi:nitrite reductase (NADH) small subunit
MAWTKLATTAELPAGALIEVEYGDGYVALCNVNGEVRAIDGTCPHQGGPLGEGALNGEFVTCPWHMWDFHSVTGACAFNDNVRVAVYPVRTEGNTILIDVPNA